MKPRFSLLNMLLAITLICVCIAWYLDRAQLNKRYEANTAALRHVLGSVNVYETQIQPRLQSRSKKNISKSHLEDIDWLTDKVWDLKSECERAYSFFNI